MPRATKKKVQRDPFEGYWECTNCHQLKVFSDPRWRWNGTIWEHRCGDAQAGYFPAEFLGDDSTNLRPRTNGHAPARSFDTEPISRVEWVAAATLHANDYNPNAVAPPERELIVLSILEDGWTQPVVTLPDGEIVDGFHRWKFSQEDQRLLDRYHGFVPVTRIIVDPVHQQMSTIRHNRARGTHGILRMADIVTKMLKAGVTAEQIQRGLGMDDEEVIRLSTSLGMPELACAENFSPAWKPGEKESV